MRSCRDAAACRRTQIRRLVRLGPGHSGPGAACRRHRQTVVCRCATRRRWATGRDAAVAVPLPSDPGETKAAIASVSFARSLSIAFRDSMAQCCTFRYLEAILSANCARYRVYPVEKVTVDHSVNVAMTIKYNKMHYLSICISLVLSMYYD